MLMKLSTRKLWFPSSPLLPRDLVRSWLRNHFPQHLLSSYNLFSDGLLYRKALPCYFLSTVDSRTEKKPCRFPSLCLDSMHFHPVFPKLVAVIYELESPPSSKFKQWNILMVSPCPFLLPPSPPPAGYFVGLWQMFSLPPFPCKHRLCRAPRGFAFPSLCRSTEESQGDGKITGKRQQILHRAGCRHHGPCETPYVSLTSFMAKRTAVSRRATSAAAKVSVGKSSLLCNYPLCWWTKKLQTQPLSFGFWWIKTGQNVETDKHDGKPDKCRCIVII